MNRSACELDQHKETDMKVKTKVKAGSIMWNN